MKRFLLALSTTAVIAAAGGVIAVSAVTNGQGDSTNDGHTQWNKPDLGALTEVSREVGFDVRVPEVPVRFPLQSAEVFSGPQGEGLKYSSTRFAQEPSALSKRDETWIEILQFGLRLTHAANDATEAVKLGVPGVDAVIWRGPDQDVYTLRTKGATFIVLVTRPSGLTVGEVESLLVSLVAKA